MSIDSSDAQTTALYQALQTTALEAYGSLLAEPLATKAASSFADEANAMLEAMLAEHTSALRERIDAQLTGGISLGKGGKRKAPAVKAPAVTNGATNGAAVASAPPAPAETQDQEPVEEPKAKTEARPAKATEAKAARPRKRPGGRSATRA